jgi:hypothetical protein
VQRDVERIDVAVAERLALAQPGQLLVLVEDGDDVAVRRPHRVLAACFPEPPLRGERDAHRARLRVCHQDGAQRIRAEGRPRILHPDHRAGDGQRQPVGQRARRAALQPRVAVAVLLRELVRREPHHSGPLACAAPAHQVDHRRLRVPVLRAEPAQQQIRLLERQPRQQQHRLATRLEAPQRHAVKVDRRIARRRAPEDEAELVIHIVRFVRSRQHRDQVLHALHRRRRDLLRRQD